MNKYPPVFFSFELSFRDNNAKDRIVFKELSGVLMELQSEDISDNNMQHHVPTSAKFSNLILKRGLAPKDSEIVTWCLGTLNGNSADSVEAKDIVVNLLDEAGNAHKSWSFIKAWPVKLTISDLENNLVIDNLEFAYSYLE